MSKEKIITIVAGIAAVGTIAYFTILAPDREVDTSTQNQNVNLDEIVAEEEVNRGSDYVLVYDPVAKEYKKLKLSVLMFKDEEDVDIDEGKDEESEGGTSEDSPTPTAPSNIGDAVTPDELASLSTSDLTDVSGDTPTDGEVLVWNATVNQWVPATLNIPTGETIDEEAIHVDEAGEIAALTEKGTPAGTDYILIEDSEDNNTKKKIQISNLPTGSSVSDIDDLGDVDTSTSAPTNGQVLVWDLVNSEWVPGDLPTSGATSANELSDVDTATIPPTAGQVLVWDAGASEWVPGDLPSAGASAIDELTDVDTSSSAPTDGQSLVWNAVNGEWEPQTIVSDTGVDTNAIHDNVSGEISSLAEKATPVAGDLILIEDSENSNTKKYVQVGSLPTGATTINELTDVDTATVAPTAGQGLVWDDESGKWITGDFAAVNHMHTDVAGYDVLGTPAEGNVLMYTETGVNITGAETTASHTVGGTSGGGALTYTWELYKPIQLNELWMYQRDDNKNMVATIKNSEGTTIATYTGNAGGNRNVFWQLSSAPAGPHILPAGIYTIDCDFTNSNYTNSVSNNWLTVSGVFQLRYGTNGSSSQYPMRFVYQEGEPVSALEYNDPSTIISQGIDDLTDVDTSSVAPTDGQSLVWNDANSAWEPATITSDTGVDTSAIHDNVSGEISVITEKTTPVAGDFLLIEDSEASNAKKRIQVGSLPTGATSADELSDVDTSSLSPTDGQALIWENTSSKWIPGDLPSAGASSLDGLSDVDTSSVAPTYKQSLLWDPDVGKFIPGDVPYYTGVPSENQVLQWGSSGLGENKNAGTNSYSYYSGVNQRDIPIYVKRGMWINSFTSFGFSHRGYIWQIKDFDTGTVLASTNGGAYEAGNQPHTFSLNSPFYVDPGYYKLSMLVNGSTDEWILQGAPFDYEDMIVGTDGNDIYAPVIVNYYLHDYGTGSWVDNELDMLSDVDTSSVAPTDGQSLVWNEANSAWEPATIVSDTGVDTSAIHDNVSGEISVITEKATPIAGDFILIEDSEDLNTKKRVQIGNLPTGATSADELSDVDTSSVAPTDGQALVWDNGNSKWIPGDVSSSGSTSGNDIGARVYISSDITVPDWTFTQLTFDSELYDDGNCHDTTTNTGRLTAPVAGKYIVMAQVSWDSQNTGLRKIRIMHSVDGEIAESQFVNDAQNSRQLVSTIIDMGVGEYVTLEVLHAQGGDVLVKNIDGGTNFMMQLIDPGLTDAPVSGVAIQTVSQNIPNNTSTVVDFDTISEDTDGLFDDVSNRVTIQENGIYVMSYKGLWINSSGGHVRTLSIRAKHSDGSYLLDTEQSVPSSGGIMKAEVTAVVNAVAGDYIDFLAYQDSGGTLALEYADARVYKVSNITSSGVTALDGLTDVDTSSVAPTDGQSLVWDNTSGQWEPGTPSATDTTALHDNVSGEISLIAEKATPVDADLLVIEDSGDSNNKKKIQIGSLPFATAINELSDVDTTTVPPVSGQALMWSDVESKWIPGDVGGGQSLDYSALSLSNPPRKDELSSGLGDPATLGAGYTSIVKDSITSRVFVVTTDGVDWYTKQLARAVDPTDGIGQYANLEYWYDAQDIQGLTDGDPIDQWDDLSGNGRNLTAQLTRRPLYYSDQANGLPTVRFDGSDDYMLADGVGLNDFTLITVVYVQDRITNNTGIVSFAPPSGYDYNTGDGLAMTVYTNDYELYVTRNVDSNPLQMQAGANTLHGTPQVITLRLQDGVAVFRINGIQVAQDTYSDLTSIDFTDLVVGTRWANGSASVPFGKNDYSELALYSAALSDIDLDDLESYLMNKWNIL